jgi:hypothetical protein
MARLVRFEYHRPGKPTSSFNQWVVLDRPDVKVLLSDAYEGPNLEVGDTVVHDSSRRSGTTSGGSISPTERSPAGIRTSSSPWRSAATFGPDTICSWICGSQSRGNPYG